MTLAAMRCTLQPRCKIRLNRKMRTTFDRKHGGVMSSKTGVRVLALIVWVLAGAHQVWAQPDASAAGGFGSSYASLQPLQKRLVDDWFKRFGATVKKPVDPAMGYESLPLSARTTFNAVTHALLMTKLTGDSGKRSIGISLGAGRQSRQCRWSDSGRQKRPAVPNLC